MTDLEIVKLCAEAMGYTGFKEYKGKLAVDGGYYDGKLTYYQPLHDDAQAMALVKKYRLDMRHGGDGSVWEVWYSFGPEHCLATRDDLNRAICECVAKMQLAKK